MKTSITVRLIKCVLTGAVLLSGAVQAGTVVLDSGSWDNVPRLVVKKGLNGGSQSTFSDVPRGEVTRANGRLCYKRSSNPNDPNSPLQQNWTCASQTISGVYVMNLN